jgi:U3 small nucleolar RNA-associated protein 5
MIVASHGNLVAVASTSRPTVQVYNNGNLQSTLNYHHSDSNVQKLIWSGSDHICALLQGEIIVWSLTRGVVVYKLTEDGINDITASDDGILLVLLTTKHSKLVVQEYSVAKQKLQLKIKAGKFDEGAVGLSVCGDKVAVRNGSIVKVIERGTGDKVCKCKLAAGQGNGWVGLTQNNVVTCTLNQVQVFDIKSGKLVNSMVVEEPSHLELHKSRPWLLVDTSVYQLESKSPACKMKESGNDVVTLSFASDSEIHALVQSPGAPLQVHGIKLLNNDGELTDKLILPMNDAQDEDDKDDEPVARKRPATSITQTLGPGQAGQESLKVTDQLSKKAKSNAEETDDDDDDDDNPTIAQRLDQLQQLLQQEDMEDEPTEEALESSTFQPKKATTESLSHLLQQALASLDDAMLELALTVRDNKVRQESIEALSNDEATLFLNQLTSRLAKKPNRASALVPWIQSLLLSGKITTSAPLIPLRNLVQERVEVFPQLLQLEGRLSLLSNF